MHPYFQSRSYSVCRVIQDESFHDIGEGSVNSFLANFPVTLENVPTTISQMKMMEHMGK